MSDTKELAVQVRKTLSGALLFFLVVAGTTYYLQSSLVLYKQYGAYAHWAAVLVAVPVIAGLILRLMNVCYPLICTIMGAAGAAAVLYPQYKTFWAEPPTQTHLAMYVIIVLGFGFIATQPLRTTFMIAFRLGRFAVPTFTASKGSDTRRSGSSSSRSGSVETNRAAAKKANRTPSLTKSGQVRVTDTGNVIAIMELLVGLTSLVLSVVSIFFLGRG